MKPVAQHVRRIPFGLREKVDEIIEKVPEGPSGWVSPLVVVPKGERDVRAAWTCAVQMRRLFENGSRFQRWRSFSMI